MSFTDHLSELRKRMIRIAAALLVGFFVCWGFRVELFEFLAGPISRALADNGIYHYQAIQVTESILVYLKTAFVFGVILTSPATFYQLWAFVSPALYKEEKTFVIPVTAFTVIFFLIGAAFSYQIILPFITDWLVKLTLEGGQAEVMVTLQNAYSTAFVFLLMFGMVFELPLVIFFLSLFQIVTAAGLARFFRYWVVLSVVIGAALTPPDPISQMMMAVPLNVLYAFGILIAWGVERSRADADETGGEHSAGLTLTRLMGSSLLLLGLAAGLVYLFVQNLPEKDFARALPEEVTWMVAGNPAILSQDANIQGALRAGDDGGTWAAAMQAAGADLTDVREAAVVGNDAGARALIVRTKGLAAGAAAAQEKAEDATVAALDEDTLAIGEDGLVKALLSVARGAAPGRELHEEEGRLLNTLRTGGPLWGFLPSPGRDDSALLGQALGADAAAVGVHLHLGERPRLVARVHATDRGRADAVEARLHALSTVARGRDGGTHRDQLAEAVTALVAEMERGANPARRARLAAIRKTLDAADRSPAAGFQAPALNLLSAPSAAWALRRDDIRMTLTSDIAPEGLANLLRRGLDALR